MQVDNNSQYKSIQEEPLDSDNTPNKENSPNDVKQLKAENRIARYEQKPERKASKMLVRLLQWADKLVMKFFTKKLLPEALQIFFDRQARANKVELKKAQIDYSVQDFAVRLYVFWVCEAYFDKNVYQINLDKLLHQLCDQLIRKKRNLADSLMSCQQQSERKQKQQELKWMQAIIKGLKEFINTYHGLTSENQVMRFLQTVTEDIMVECLRKPGNKLIKKKQKLQVKIKYFQDKIAQILGNRQFSSSSEEKALKSSRVVQKNNIIIQSISSPFGGLTRSVSNSSAFRKYTGENQNIKYDDLQKKQIFEMRFQTPNKFQLQSKQQLKQQTLLFIDNMKMQDKFSQQKAEKTDSQINVTCEIKIQQEENIQKNQ